MYTQFSSSSTTAVSSTGSRPPMTSLLSPPLTSLHSAPSSQRFPFPPSSFPSSLLLSTRGSTTAVTSLQRGLICSNTRSPVFTSRPVTLFTKRRNNVSNAVSMTDGQSDEPTKLSLDDMTDKASNYWDKLPEPVKSFPWKLVLRNFIQLVIDLTASIIKYLSAPLLVVTALSEMSYCAHERKLRIVPIPLIIGFALAGILRNTALELTPSLKDADIPWHLIAISVFFILLKLPGPYYPYWGRIIIPHLANGGLLRTLWLAYVSYGRP